MEMHFAGQPFDDHLNLVDFIERIRADGCNELKIAVAWAKRSGLGRVWDALNEFRNQGGTVTLVLGVSEGGATREGLELALELADHPYVFHDPRRTFHPKVYFASSPSRRSLLIGSSNLTAGGLSWNYEASMWVDWEAGEDTTVTEGVLMWFDMLIAATGSCRPLTAELIDQLERSDDILLGSETRARRVRTKKSDTPEDNDSTNVSTIGGLFKPVTSGLRKLPGLSAKFAPPGGPPPAGSTEHPQAAGKALKTPAHAAAAPFSVTDVQRRWFKQLDNTAAQQVKSTNSRATGNLRLSKEGAAVNHTTYFREDFFGDLPWTSTEGKESEQEVVVTFRTWIDGDDFDLQELRLSHDPRRISNQGNVPTVLHWGQLSKVLRRTNYVGHYVSLERTKGGAYNLVISQAPRGDYQA
jgi:hypothetical protein